MGIKNRLITQLVKIVIASREFPQNMYRCYREVEI
jgi:hypothetical protein